MKNVLNKEYLISAERKNGKQIYEHPVPLDLKSAKKLKSTLILNGFSNVEMLESCRKEMSPVADKVKKYFLLLMVSIFTSLTFLFLIFLASYLYYGN